jgi:hypothetical protein
MKNAIVAEYHKIIRSDSLYWFCGVFLVLMFALSMLKPSKIAAEANYFMAGSAYNPWYGATHIHSAIKAFVLMPFSILIACWVVFMERKNNLHKVLPLLPVSSFEVFLAKLMWVVAIVFVVSLILAAIAPIGAYIGNHNNEAIDFSAHSPWPSFGLSALLSLKLFLCALGAIAVLIFCAFFFSNYYVGALVLIGCWLVSLTPYFRFSPLAATLKSIIQWMKLEPVDRYWSSYIFKQELISLLWMGVCLVVCFLYTRRRGLFYP